MTKKKSLEIWSIAFILFFVGFKTAISQIQYFKNINTIDESSKPSNFIKLDQNIYFVAEGSLGFELLRYSSINELTKVFEGNIVYNQYSNESMVQQSGDYVYFYKYQYNSNNLYDLYRTQNGVTELVVEKIPLGRLITVADKLFLESNGIYEIKNYQIIDRFTSNTNLGTTLKYSNLFASYYKAFQLNDILYFFHFEKDIQNNYTLRILGLNNDGNVMAMDSLLGLVINGYNIVDEPIIHQNKQFFAASKIDYNSNIVVTSLFKFNGGDIIKVRNIGESQIGYFLGKFNTTNLQSLIKWGNNLAFVYDSRELWVSTGDSIGTFKVQNFDEIPQYESGIKIPYTLKSHNNNLYFAAKTNNQTELWKSDGSIVGTQLVKDIYSSVSSHPHNFQVINNQLYFRTAKDEIWQTDGTSNGTNLIIAIPREPDYVFRLSEKSSFTAIDATRIIYNKYDNTVGYEPFLYDMTTNTEILIQNLNSLKQTQLYSNIKVQLDSIWYFNGRGDLGSELWRTDGTTVGTYLVKDFYIGQENAIIKEMVASDSLIFMIVRFTNSKADRLYKSNGTSEGTIEININLNNEPVFNLEQLAVSGNALFVKRNSIFTGDLLKIEGNSKSFITNTSNWTNLSTLAFAEGLLIVPSRPFLSIIWPDSIVRLNDFALYNYNVFYVKLGSKIVLFDLANLYLSNGTNGGTTLIKKTHNNPYFQPDIFFNIYSTGAEVFLFLLSYETNVPTLKIWRTNGTSIGTYIVGEIPAEGLVHGVLKIAHADGFVIFSIVKQNQKNEFYVIKDSKVSFLFNSENSSILSSEFTIFKNKIYFTYNRNDTGTELYVTDGTNEGTFLVDEIEAGIPSSKIQHLMPFRNKMIFQGFDHNHGYSLYQYTPSLCEGNRNYVVKSGDWSDAANWSCGHVPNMLDYVIINPPYKISSTANQVINTKQLLVNQGGGLLFEKGAAKMVNPN